jgi:hypothetical protein
MEDDHEACNTRLHLGLGFFGDRVPRKETRNHDQKEEKPLVCLDFMFPREEAINVDHKADRSTFRKFDRDDEYPNKENDSDSHPNKDAGRKKLRLSKDQSILLEDCFKLHSTLSPVNFPMLHFINVFFFFFFLFMGRFARVLTLERQTLNSCNESNFAMSMTQKIVFTLKGLSVVYDPCKASFT